MMTPPREQPRGYRFAPYSVWMTLRVVTMVGAGLIILWFIWAIAALFSAFRGGGLHMLPPWLAIVGLVVGGSGRGFRRDDQLPPFGEMIGRMLASKHCPHCGQSIFDHRPSSGYVPDGQSRRWWPSRSCAQCGHDMTVRTAA